MMDLLPTTEDCLLKAGWHPGRIVDTRKTEASLKDEGYLLHSAAQEFLRSFGGLVVTRAHCVQSRLIAAFHFNAARAARGVFRELVSEYEEAVGQRLVTIGEGLWHMTIMMGEDGLVYAGFEDTLLLIGENGPDAINALCEGRDGTCIDLPKEKQADHEITETPTLSAATRIHLEQAGWFLGRSIGTSHVEKSLVQQGFTSVACVTRFLREFNGLVLMLWHSERGDYSSRCDLDAMLAASGFPQTHILQYRQRLGVILTPIGTVFENTRTLLMAEDERVFMGMRESWETLHLVGISGIDALNALCEGRQLRSVW